MKKTFLVEGPRHHLPMINREKDIFQFSPSREKLEVERGERREERVVTVIVIRYWWECCE